MNRSLIFGANGQDGHYLSELCKAQGIQPIGISRSGHGIRGDVSCYKRVEELIREFLPTYVFHLAANSTTNHDALFENHQTIATGTLNILEAVKRYHPSCKVFISGSATQFKNVGRAIKENDEFEGNSAYSVARIQSTYAARYYRSIGVRTYVGYLFHHESPFRKPNHVSQTIVTAVHQIAIGKRQTLELGNTSVEKEWTFAGDIAAAMLLLVQQEEIFEATIGSGIGYTIENWLELCFAHIGKDWRDHVILRKDFIPEYNRLVSDPKTILKLGWSPTIDLAELAVMMMNSRRL